MTRATEQPPCLYRSLELRAEPSGDGKTFTFSASSETTTVKRYFWERGETLPEVLLHRSGSVDFSAASSMLFNHDPDRIVGPLSKIEVDSSRKLRVTAAFDDTPEGSLARTRVASGSLKGASIGYEVPEGGFRYVGPGETFEGVAGPAMVATRWTLREVSLTPVAADTSVGIGRSHNPTVPPARKEGSTMPETTTTPGTTPGGPPSPQVVPPASEGERSRCEMIRSLCNFAGIPAEKTLEYIAGTKTAEEVRKEIETLRRGETETPEPAIQTRNAGAATITRDARDSFARGAVNAALLRGGIKLSDKEDREHAEAFRRMSLNDIAHECLRLSGRNVPRGDRETVVAMALEAPGPRVRLQGNFDLRSGAPLGHYSSDLPNIVANIANKSLFIGWQEAMVTYPTFCTIASIPDFKDKTIAKLSNLAELPEIESDSDEVPEIFMSDDGETYALRTFSALVSISRKLILNDDTGALTRLPFKAGAAARRRINGLVYYILNNGADSTKVAMSDATELFASSRGNYATTSSALAIGTLDAGVAALQNMVGPKGEVLNIPAKYLIVPPNLRMTGSQLVNSSAIPLTNMSAGVINPYQGELTLVVDAEMRRGSGGSATAWCLAADQNVHETIEVGLLNGIDAPVFEEFDDPRYLGKRYRITIDAAAKAADPQGLYKASGSS